METSKMASDELRMHNDLLACRQEYQLLAEYMTDMIWTLDPEIGRFTYISPSVSRLRGYSQKEALHQSIEESLEAWSADIFKKEIASMSDKLSSGDENPDICVIELQFKIKKSNSVWTETTLRIRYNNDGKMEILGVSRYIQKRKEAEFILQAKSDELERFFSLALDLLCIADTDGYFRKLNKAWENILGYNIHELEKARFLDFIHPDDIQGTLNALDSLMKGNMLFAFENRYRDKRGDYHWIEWRAVPYENKLIYAAARDITQRKNNEIKLADLSDKLMKMNIDKDKFFSILAHDLRNSINSLLGTSEMLLEDVRDGEIGEIAELAGIINKTTFQTNNMLEDLLMIVKSRYGDLVLQPVDFDLGEMSSMVVKNFKMMAHSKNIKIDHHESEKITVHADAVIIKTIMRNLVSNAIKFTNNDGFVDISSHVEQQFAVVVVSDNGVGIDMERLSSLWDVYNKVSTPGTAGETGSGMGLALCSELIQKSGGKVWVETEPSKGSKFSFTIPLSN